MAEHFSYRAKPTTMLLAGGFFAIGAVVLHHKYATNDRGLILNGLVEFGVEGATRFYGVLVLCSIAFVAIAAAMIVRGFLRKDELVLGDDFVEVPGGFFRRATKRIDFAQIDQASLQEISGQRMLTLRAGRTKVTIVRSLLPSKADFERIVAHIGDRSGGRV